MWFWLPATALATAVTLSLVLALLRRRAGGAGGVSDVQIYRDQLRAVERDVARGLIGADDAGRIRVEVSRRLLSADKAQKGARPTATAPRTLSLIAAGLVALLVFGGATGLYLAIGAPGYPDLPLEKRIEMAAEFRANRPSQAQTEAEFPEDQAQGITPKDPKYAALMTRLRTAVAQRPDDLRGQALLARNEAALGNLRAAYAAQARVIALKGARASAADYATLGDMMIGAAHGYVSPEAEAALQNALKRDPENGLARYYTGLMFAQTGRPDIAFGLWRALLENSPAGAAWLGPIRSRIAALARLAGVRYQPPVPPPAAPENPGAAQPADGIE